MATRLNSEERLRMNLEIFSRIEQIVREKGSTIAELTREIKVSTGAFIRISAGNGVLSADILVSILNLYRDISPDWLLFGAGPKYRGGEMKAKTPFSKTLAKNSEIKRVVRLSANSLKDVAKTAKQAEKSISDIHKMLDGIQKLQRDILAEGA